MLVLVVSKYIVSHVTEHATFVQLFAQILLESRKDRCSMRFVDIPLAAEVIFLLLQKTWVQQIQVQVELVIINIAYFHILCLNGSLLKIDVLT